MLTTLDIINQMLASTGTAPLTTNDTYHPAYKKAMNKLQTVSTSVQSMGWWFNASVRTLRQNVSGEVILPNNTLHADPTDDTSVLVRRGKKLYNPVTATYVIGADTKVNFIEQWEIDELPPVASEYIRARAVYEYYRDEDGVQPKLSEYKEERNTAWVQMKDEHLKNKDLSWFTGMGHKQLRRGYRMSRLPVRDTEV